MSVSFFRVGLITRPHGVRGALKVRATTDFPERFYALKQAFLEHGGAYNPVEVETLGTAADSVLIRIAGVDTRETAEALRGAYLCVRREDAAPLPEYTYYVDDLIGCRVFSSDGAFLGEMEDVWETGANDVYVIRGERRLLVPALKKLLLEVDIPGRRMTFRQEVLAEVAFFED